METKEFILKNAGGDMISYWIREGGKVGGPGDMGRWFVMKPENQNIVIDYTAPMGKCSGLYWSLIFWMLKQDYKIMKVDESMNVTPIHTEIYNLLVGQRERIETQIKSGLASAASAVADYELVYHDYRRYKEIWDYLQQGKEDEHVLRSLFIDRVDAHTGEPFSLISMAKRWPTIITDFIRMGSREYKGKEWKNIKEIMDALDVPSAEATVLKTKNELFKEWKRLFLPEVKNRLARIKALMDARKRSIEEYRKWLRPYVARHKMMKDALEGAPASNLTSPFVVPAFGQAVMATGVRLWAWKPLLKTEPHKPETRRQAGKQIIDPYDDIVKVYKEAIEAKYNVTITDDEVKTLIADKLNFSGQHGEPYIHMEDMYFIFLDINIERTIIRMPGGGEIEDMMFNPITTYLLSANALLIHAIEALAMEKQFDEELNELIGVSEEEAMKKIEREEKAKEEPTQSKKTFPERLSDTGRRIKNFFNRFYPYFFRSGPYESTMKERVTKIYLVNSGTMYGEVVNFIKEGMGIAKAAAEIYE